MDIFVPRGAWLRIPIRPTLLRNNGAGDSATSPGRQALLDPVNSNAAAWADFDNDGWLDLSSAARSRPIASTTTGRRHVRGGRREGRRNKASPLSAKAAPGSTYDNDRYPDLFLNNLAGRPGCSITTATVPSAMSHASMGINGPYHGFSCWTWDFDNDGWLDIFATCYDRTLGDVVKGLLGQPHSRYSSRLYRNLAG